MANYMQHLEINFIYAPEAIDLPYSPHLIISIVNYLKGKKLYPHPLK